MPSSAALERFVSSLSEASEKRRSLGSWFRGFRGLGAAGV